MNTIYTPDDTCQICTVSVYQNRKKKRGVEVYIRTKGEGAANEIIIIRKAMG